MSIPQPQDHAFDPVALLVGAQAEDGGWPAYPGLVSNTEATALGCMALNAAARPGSDQTLRRATAWLVERQREDGSWGFTDAVPEPSWASSLAILALARTNVDESVLDRGASWLVRQEGASFPFLMWLRYKLWPEQQVTELNPSLKGWAWAPETFSWIEPTSHALMALKALRGHVRVRSAEARIRGGERMMLDRMCVGGGWNYGNSRILGVELEPFPDTTALALLALQDRPRDDAIRSSLAALGRMVEGEASGLTLALSILCYRVYERDTTALAARLHDRFKDTAFLNETRALALAALALADDHALDVRGNA